MPAGDLLQGGEGLAAVPEKQDQFRDAVAETIIYAQQLKPEVINVLPGRVLDIERKQAYLATFNENLRFAVDEFSKLGIKTVFEAKEICLSCNAVYLIHFGEKYLSKNIKIETL